MTLHVYTWCTMVENCWICTMHDVVDRRSRSHLNPVISSREIMLMRTIHSSSLHHIRHWCWCCVTHADSDIAGAASPMLTERWPITQGLLWHATPLDIMRSCTWVFDDRSLPPKRSWHHLMGDATVQNRPPTICFLRQSRKKCLKCTVLWSWSWYLITHDLPVHLGWCCWSLFILVR